jgi:thiol:disulfide interchange protein/DsbC/DsbD-like thiol-disulfide interchange protein
MSRKHSNRRFVALAVAVLLVASGAASAQLPPGKPKTKVNLVSSVDGIIPGQAFDVGIHFELEEDWHIYWINSGESGLPPKVTWALPDGFTAGDLQFPMPKRRVDAGNITTNIIEGEPVLLARLTPPEAIAENEVTLQAKVTYLICKTRCFRESVDLRLELPVHSGGEAGPANERLFQRARRVLPEITSKYVTVAASTTARGLSPGLEFELALAVDVARGHHIQSHEPLTEEFIKADVFMEPTEGITFKKPVFPKPHFRTIPVLGKISEYSGRIVVRVPAEVDEEPPVGPVRFAGLFQYQACTKTGGCFFPAALKFELVPATASRGPDSDTSMAAGHADTPGGGLETGQPTPGSDAAATQTATTDGSWLTGFLGRFGVIGLLIGCFFYGLFLNATPCVLPVLSIKVLGFVQQAHESRRRTLVLGLAFGIGVILFFVILGFLAAAGKNVLQYPAAVIGLSAIVMALALAMLGVYTLQAPATAAKFEAGMQKEGLFASFGKGALAPVLGFACTGPLLAGAWGWATQQLPHIAVLAFLFAGLGMASPYVLLGANPKWLGFLPKPGQWMITFERIMGFLLLAMVIWLLSPLVPQIGATGLLWTLAFFVAIAMGCWVLGKVDLTMAAAQRWRYRGGAAAIIVAAGLLVYGWILPMAGAEASVELPWRTWSAEAVDDAVGSGKTVFVDFTAAWCTVCKLNKKVAINTPEVYDKIMSLGVVLFQGDFTSDNSRIAAEIQKHGRSSLPLDLIYPAGKPDNPIILRTNLTKTYLLQKLDEAGPSRTGVPSPASPDP